jgi:hypothetical protein
MKCLLVSDVYFTFRPSLSSAHVPAYRFWIRREVDAVHAGVRRCVHRGFTQGNILGTTTSLVHDVAAMVEWQKLLHSCHGR